MRHAVCTAAATMNRLFGIGSLLLIVGNLLGCSDAGLEAQESTSRESTALQASIAPESDDGSDVDALDEAVVGDDDEPAANAGNDELIDPAVDPTYIVYFVPVPGSRLFNDVRLFLTTFPSLATNFPPPGDQLSAARERYGILQFEPGASGSRVAIPTDRYKRRHPVRLAAEDHERSLQTGPDSTNQRQTGQK